MSQYKTGTVSVTNGSQVVTGTGTAWLSNVQPGDGFTVAGTQVPYTVGSVDSNGQITLSSPYAGSSGSGQAYTIWRDFTTNENLPELSQGDIETATIWTRALRKIDSLLGAATTTARGTVEKATAAEAKAGAQDKFPDAAGVHDALNQYGLGTDGFAAKTRLTDCDAQKISGTYPVAAGAAGSPVADPGILMVYSWENNNTIKVQEFAPIYGTPGEKYIRTFAAGAASYTPWYKAVTNNNILGTVSQFGGLPTGAIIERGSNANGEYVKLADGTMICTAIVSVDLTTAQVNTYPFPASFLTTGRVAAYGGDYDGFSPGSINNEAIYTAVVTGNQSQPLNQQWYVIITNGTGDITSRQFNLCAIGRWF